MARTVEDAAVEVMRADVLARPPEPAIEYTLPVAKVGNVEQVDAFVGAVESFFAGVEIDPENEKQVKELRQVRADLNKVAKAIDDKRKGMDKAVKAAMGEADGVLNGLRDRLKAVYEATGEQVKAADALWFERRMRALAEEYEGVAPDLMALVPLESFTAKEKRLAQKAWGEAKARQELDKLVCTAVQDRRTLASLALEHASEADMRFCETLSIEAALVRNQELVWEDQKREQHEREAVRLERAVSHESVMAEREGDGPARYTVTFVGTEAQAARVKVLLVSMGVAGRSIRKEQLCTC